MIIGITGSDGFFGWHLRALLKTSSSHEVRLANRQIFASPERLADFVSGLDALVHLAGMNRGGDSEVEHTNVWLAKSLVAALERTNAHPRLAFANSLHIDRDTGYGRGKRKAAAILRKWSVRTGGTFADLIFPHIFGEHGKPFYNSVVSTFCYQLAKGDSATIIVDSQIELLHAQRAALRCLDAIESAENGATRVAGSPVQVSTLLARLMHLQECYRAQLMPPVSDQLNLELFNTFRSYLYPDHYPVGLQLHTDARGSLFEAIKSTHGGQTFLSVTRPGITRGNHFHARKIERFLVISGEAEIRLRRLFTRQVEVFRVSGAAPCYIDMPTFHTHNITNTGPGDLLTLFWCNEIFNPQDSDTFPEPVSDHA